MKTFKLLLIPLLLAYTTMYSQNCIDDETTISQPFYAADFERDSYVTIASPSTTNGMQDYMNEDFTLEFWVFPQWSATNEAYYFMFGYGKWDDDENSFLVSFESKDHSGDNWAIRVSDGNDNEGNTDLIYKFDNDVYNSQYKNQWNHICVVFDSPADSDNNGTIRLYVNGSLKKTQTGFDLQAYSSNSTEYGSQEYCYLGEGLGGSSSENHDESFYGYMAGFRLWNNDLSQQEINYIKDKTFTAVETFNDSYNYLFNNLVVNMVRSYSGPEYNIYSTTHADNDIGLSEHDIPAHYNLYHPTAPPKAFNLSTTEDCDNITINWAKAGYGTSYVYKKRTSAPAQSSYTLLCITNDTSFTDYEVEAGEIYEYMVNIAWYNDDDPFNTNNGVYHSENTTISAQTTMYPKIQNFIVSDDASMGNCNGQIKLQWDALNPPPGDYYIQSKTVSSDWTTLVNGLTNTEYIHNVPNENLGELINYRIDGGGDGCVNHSEEITGTANRVCETAPANVTSVDSAGSIYITWDFTQSGAPATGFKIYRKTTSSGSYGIIESNVDISVREYFDSDADMCTEYFYKIEAFNQCGSSGSMSSESTGTILPVKFDNVFTYQENSETKSYFDASKGYFNQKVELEWSVNPNKLGDIEAYEIYRRQEGQSYSLLTTINNSNAGIYEDLSTEANLLYQYLIRAIGTCSGSDVVSDSLITAGFRNSTGVVSGKITYEGGNAVENVEVRIESDEAGQTRSLAFDGVSDFIYSTDFVDDSIFHHPISVDAWIKPELVATGERNIFFSAEMGIFYVGLRNMKPIAGINTHVIGCADDEEPIARLEADTVLEADNWYHIAVDLDPENGIFRLYLNGAVQDSVSYLNPQVPWSIEDYEGNSCGVDYDEYTVAIGIGRGTNTMFSGNIDEVRIWQKTRTSAEIERDYVRILSGTEDSLIGYYRFDEGFGEAAYDLSKADGEFNKNNFSNGDGSIGFPEWALATPSFEQLHPSGITDEHGNYIIKGIKYNGSGGIFNVSPVFGIHEFSPTDINVFISDASPVHNNIDFTDQSSFRFVGNVYYRNTNFPVEGAKIFVDNRQVFDAGGYPVLTDANGLIDINVPIGNHYVSVQKDGHVFVNNGQWPAPTDAQPYRTHNFMDDVFGITMYDSTTVKLCGRYVGGNVEGNKKIGFGKSKNNIGVGTIVFKNEQDYDVTYNSDIEHSSTVSVITNQETGEYEIYLLPEVYKIESAGNNHYPISNDDLGLIDLSNIPVETVLTDTTYTEEINEGDTIYTEEVAEYTYHFLRNFIAYSTPEIILTADGENNLSGEEELIVNNPNTGENDTIDISVNSPFEYPIFLMGKTYDIDIQLLSYYYNYDNNDTIEDIVPVADADISVTNNIEMGEPTYNLTTDSNGKASDYNSFKVGLPNMNLDESNGSSFTKTISITAQTDNIGDVSYNGGTPFRGYTLGCVDAGGANFVTYGPEVPQFILRDPPGSKSYTYLEKESVYSISRDYSYTTLSNNVYDNELMLGIKFEIGGGLAGPVFESEVQSDINAGIETTSYIDRNGEYRQTYRFLKRYSTSDAQNAVGSIADVFVGKSTNMFFTETTNLRVYAKSYCDTSGLDYLPNSEMADSTVEYTIGKRPGFAVSDDESNTFFVYTQDHILNNLLPEYRDMVYTLLGTDRYTSMVPESHVLYGTPNDAPIWRDSLTWQADSLHPSYVFNGEEHEIDSVAFLNQQISVWLQTLALNEAVKVRDDMDEVENISFDGTAGAYSNELEYTSSDVQNRDYFCRFALFGGSESGFNINGTGLITYSQTYKAFDLGLGESDEETNSLKWGYVLDDTEQGDYYSVDVMRYNMGTFREGLDNFLNENNFDDAGRNLDNISLGTGLGGIGAFIGSAALSKIVNPLAGQALGMAYAIATTSAYMGVMSTYKKKIANGTSMVYFSQQGASPIFKIRGGQSRCPYEAPEYTTFYYNDNAEPILLHTGTQNHESPKLAIEPASMVNVPADQPAVFDLKLMNESPTDKSLTYELKVDEASNPDGAIIKIDGLTPNRSFFIQAGQTLTKTLTVEQGASGELDYENLQLILHSSCQYNPDDHYPDIADTISFSAHFIPVCSNVEFGNVTQNWVLNSAYNDTLPVNITGYNINHPTFQRIYFQYLQAGSTPTTVMTYFNDTTGYAAYTGAKALVDGEAELNYNFSASALNDGPYTLILKTICSDGSTHEADRLEGIIDRVNPRPYGTPQPADGILSYGEDISIRFNETINEGDLYAHADYISVRAITNGTDLIDNDYLLHDACIHFDGQQNNMTVSPGINLDGTSFTIEFWAQRKQTGEECLLSLNYLNGTGLWIGFNAEDKFVVRIDGNELVSDETYNQIDNWNHYAVVYNQGGNGVSSGLTAIISSDANTEEKYQQANVFGSLEGPLYVAYCPSNQTAFYGNMHELRIWNSYKTSVDIASTKGQILSGYEQGLYGLWPMNESFGDIAYDLAFGRDAVVNASRQVSRNGKALSFDGTSYAAASTGSMVFSEEDDFSIEFWFKTAVPQTDVCMFSNGKGDGSLSEHAWSIFATSTGNIQVLNNGNTLTTTGNYLDNNWHHLAVSVNRLGYVSLYLDGELVSTRSASGFGGFGAAQMVLGARWYNQYAADNYDMNFTGEIDELRVWNACRKESHIKTYMNHALTGDEFGLKAYFPFEDVRIEDPSVSNETLLNLTADTIAQAGGLSLTGAGFTDESPMIKLHRPEVSLPFNYTINNDEVIITPAVEASLIENRTLTISVKRVKDMRGNRMSTTASWTAFVDQNNVVWDLSELQIEKDLDEEKLVQVNIRNKGGIQENYTIENIPAWMQVYPETGSLNPMETQEIEITILPQLNVGTYNVDLHLNASTNYNERLAMQVKVNGNLPDWTVDESAYDYSANLIGQLKINDIISVDTEDIVACFVSNECRGLANVEYLTQGNMYLLFMNIYSNQSQGEELTFKVYDASTGNIYSQVTPTLTFVEDALFGSVSSPVEINAQDFIEQHIVLNEEWNWVSFNVYGNHFNNIGSVLTNWNASPEDVIKIHNGPYTNMTQSGVWSGTLTALDYLSGYKIYANQAAEFNVSGNKVIADTVSIPVVQGWNYIGFPSQNNMPLMNALSNLNPENDDIIKSQHEFAVYDETLGWTGSLSYLQPGKAYMLKISNSGTINFTQSGDYTMIPNIERIELPATESNMSMILDVNLTDVDDEDVLIAYNGNIHCGYAKCEKLPSGENRFYMCVNASREYYISFKLHSADDNKLAKEVFAFNANEHLGSLNEPVILHFEEEQSENVQFAVYPNPFKNELLLNISIDKQEETSIEITNILGELIQSSNINLNAGVNQLKLSDSFDFESLTQGVYFVKIKVANTEYVKQIVKQ